MHTAGAVEEKGSWGIGESQSGARFYADKK